MLNTQYKLVKGARAALFAYCDTIAKEDLFKPSPVFNNSSMGSLLVHIANVYVHWLVVIAQAPKVQYFEEGEVLSMVDIRKVYSRVDEVCYKFIDRYKGKFDELLNCTIPGQHGIFNFTPLQIFTHAFAHEFHHKGQILSISRQLGYIPADTDVIRF